MGRWTICELANWRGALAGAVCREIHWGSIMNDLLEKRVAEVETLVWEIPNLMNLRFGRYETELSSMRTAIVDNTGRLVAVERAMIMIQTDMRDLRGGVTRQLIAQDQRLADLEQGLLAMRGDVAGIKDDIAGTKSDTEDIKSEIAGTKSEIGGLSGRVATLETEIRGIKTEIGGIKAEISGMKADISSLKEMMSEVLRRLPAG